MKIAMYISGRATCYEEKLLSFLEESNHDIDIFMSLNDVESESNTIYYNKMKVYLHKYLKGLEIKEYKLPNDFVYLNKHNHAYQEINNIFVPYNIMSMYYNDNKAFNMIKTYEETNNIKYDIYMKFRPDVLYRAIPTIEISSDTSLVINSIIPECDMHGLSIYNNRIISDVMVWGNNLTMSIYSNTYEYVLLKLKETSGHYLIHHESGYTDNIYEHNISINYINMPYTLSVYRRQHDLLKTNITPLYVLDYRYLK